MLFTRIESLVEEVELLHGRLINRTSTGDDFTSLHLAKLIKGQYYKHVEMGKEKTLQQRRLIMY